MKKESSHVIKVAIRDDDLSFYSDPSKIDFLYKPYYGNIPISFGVTPFVIDESIQKYPGNSKSTKISLEENDIDIAKNQALVEYIKKGLGNKFFYLALHGFNHGYAFKKSEYIGECIWKDKERLNKELALAKNHLEKLFSQKLEVFIPPYNAISQKCIDVLNGLGVREIAAVLSIKNINRRVSFRYIKYYFKRLFYKISHLNKAYSIYPKVVEFKDHKEVFSIIFHSCMSFEKIKSIFDMYFSENIKAIVINVHHQELIESPVFLNEFRSLLDYLLNKKEVKFVNIKEIFYE
jgi:predicted deacetylase